eukprot:1522237-Pleurochrysis_carterae.AAC.2
MHRGSAHCIVAQHSRCTSRHCLKARGCVRRRRRRAPCLSTASYAPAREHHTHVPSDDSCGLVARELAPRGSDCRNPALQRHKLDAEAHPSVRPVGLRILARASQHLQRARRLPRPPQLDQAREEAGNHQSTNARVWASQ